MLRVLVPLLVRDVFVGHEEQNHLTLLILNGHNVQETPELCTWMQSKRQTCCQCMMDPQNVMCLDWKKWRCCIGAGVTVSRYTVHGDTQVDVLVLLTTSIYKHTGVTPSIGFIFSELSYSPLFVCSSTLLIYRLQGTLVLTLHAN